MIGCSIYYVYTYFTFHFFIFVHIYLELKAESDAYAERKRPYKPKNYSERKKMKQRKLTEEQDTLKIKTERVLALQREISYLNTAVDEGCQEIDLTDEDIDELSNLMTSDEEDGDDEAEGIMQDGYEVDPQFSGNYRFKKDVCSQLTSFTTSFKSV